MQVKKRSQSLHIIYVNTAYTKATLDSYDIP